MILSGNLPIMPKEIRPSMARSMSTTAVPYPTASATMQRNAAIWSVADDEILLQARASGLNWQPISTRHFPNKTANACRKRHERLIERRHVEDWDAQKLEVLAQEYALVRKEMWEILASRVGERWAVVEAKVGSLLYLHCWRHHLTMWTVHGERPQRLAVNRSYSAAPRFRQPGPTIVRRGRYFRTQQRLRHRPRKLGRRDGGRRRCCEVPAREISVVARPRSIAALIPVAV